MGRKFDQGWLRVEPSEGSGDGQLTYTTREANNGRNQRSKDSVVTGASEAEGTVHVVQSGRPLYVRFYPTGYTVPSSGNSALNIYGYTNAKTLTFNVQSDPDSIITTDFSSVGYSSSLDEAETWDGPYHNGAGPQDDPGGAQEWMFKLTVSVDSTSGTSQSVARIRVTGSDDNSSVHTDTSGTNPDATITRSGAAAFTQVGPDSNGPWDDEVTINVGWQEGQQANAYVHSNESWNVTINA